jgi:hypothetical protein
VFPDQMRHHIGLERHPIRHLGDCHSLFHFRPPLRPTDELIV